MTAPPPPAWEFYLCRVDGAPASITVDLALAEAAPLDGLVEVHAVHLPCRDPGEHGMGTEAEAARLGPLEEGLATALTQAGLRYVGRIRNKGRWQLTLYGPTGSRPAIDAAIVATLDGTDQPFAVTGGDDADWEYFTGFLLPDAERWQWILDRRVVQALAEAGDDPEVPRPVEHRVSFAQGGDVRGFIEAVEAEGYHVRGPAPEDPEAVVELTREEPVLLGSIHDAVMALKDVTEAHGGLYGGWGAPVSGAQP